jgi:hypothetical protein
MELIISNNNSCCLIAFAAISEDVNTAESEPKRESKGNYIVEVKSVVVRLIVIEWKSLPQRQLDLKNEDSQTKEILRDRPIKFRS